MKAAALPLIEKPIGVTKKQEEEESGGICS